MNYFLVEIFESVNLVRAVKHSFSQMLFQSYSCFAGVNLLCYVSAKCWNLSEMRQSVKVHIKHPSFWCAQGIIGNQSSLARFLGMTVRNLHLRMNGIKVWNFWLSTNFTVGIIVAGKKYNVIHRPGGPYWEKLCTRSRVRPEAAYGPTKAGE